MRRMLTGVAYFVNSGAFRLCWVRLGYDPRREAGSRMLQAVDCRAASVGGAPAAKRPDARTVVAKFGGLPVAKAGTQQIIDVYVDIGMVSAGQAPPSLSSVAAGDAAAAVAHVLSQMDVASRLLLPLLSDRSAYSTETGWCEKSDMVRIRKQCGARIAELMAANAAIVERTDAAAQSTAV